MRAGAEVIYQATFARDGWRGRADFLIRVDEPSDLGAWSYEPYDTKLARSREAGRRAPARVVLASEIAAIQGRLPERLHVVLGTSEVETYRPATSTPILRTAQRRLRAHVEERPDDLPVAVRALLALRLHPGLPRALGGDDHLTRVASIRRDQIEKLDTASASTTLAGLAESPPDSARAPRSRRRCSSALRDQAGLQLHRYRTGELTRRLLEPEERARPRPPAAALARRPLLRHGGRPVLRARPAGSSSCSACSGASPTARRLPAVLGARPRRRAAGVRGVRRPRPRAPRRAPRHARLPLRRLRAVDARAAHGRARDARGGGRRAAPRRGPRRPASRSSARACAPASDSYSLKEVEKFFFTRTADVELGQRRRDRVRALARRPATRRGSTRSRPTTRRTASRRSSCATGCSSGEPRPRPSTASRSRSGRRPSARGEDGDGRGARPRRRASATRCSRRRTAATSAGSRRSCSTTTAARRARAGGGTSAGSR